MCFTKFFFKYGQCVLYAIDVYAGEMIAHFQTVENEFRIKFRFRKVKSMKTVLIPHLFQENSLTKRFHEQKILFQTKKFV